MPAQVILQPQLDLLDAVVKLVVPPHSLKDGPQLLHEVEPIPIVAFGRRDWLARVAAMRFQLRGMEGCSAADAAGDAFDFGRGGGPVQVLYSGKGIVTLPTVFWFSAVISLSMNGSP